VRALPRPQAQARQPVLRRLPVVLRPVLQTLVRLVLQALALVQVPVQQEYLLSMLRAQNRVGPVVQV
jgi:hypothetical protein